jgi:hypothetical protein
MKGMLRTYSIPGLHGAPILMPNVFWYVIKRVIQYGIHFLTKERSVSE